MNGPLNDLVIAWRRVSRAPVFALFAIATLAVGIGATTAMWSIVRLVMAPPSGVRDAETIVNINHAPRGGFPLVRMSWPDYQDLPQEPDCLRDGVGVVILSSGRGGQRPNGQRLR